MESKKVYLVFRELGFSLDSGSEVMNDVLELELGSVGSFDHSEALKVIKTSDSMLEVEDLIMPYANGSLLPQLMEKSGISYRDMLYSLVVRSVDSLIESDCSIVLLDNMYSSVVLVTK